MYCLWDPSGGNVGNENIISNELIFHIWMACHKRWVYYTIGIDYFDSFLPKHWMPKIICMGSHMCLKINWFAIECYYF